MKKKVDRARKFAFTLNNYEEKDIEDMKKWEVIRLLVAREDTGTPHLQGWVGFRKSYTLNMLKKLNNRIHWGNLLSEEGSDKYCNGLNKDYTAKEGYIETVIDIDERSQGKRSDLDRAVDCLREHGIKRLKKEHPVAFIKYHRGFEKLDTPDIEPRNTKPYVVWLVGPTGSGKSRRVVDTFGEENIYVKDEQKWWDLYRGEECIHFEDYRGGIKFATLLRILDRYKYLGEVKGSYTNINSPYIYITSAKEPQDCYPNVGEDRKQLLRRIDEVTYVGYDQDIDIKDDCISKCVPGNIACNFTLFKTES